MSEGTPPYRLLMVDDNEDDAALMDINLRAAGLSCELSVLDEGEKAERFFLGEPPPGGWPDLVLLDLNLPRRSGAEVLRTVKSDPRFRQLPVLILTTDASPAELEALRAYPATDCRVKPFSLKDYAALIELIRTRLTVLPSPPNP